MQMRVFESEQLFVRDIFLALWRRMWVVVLMAIIFSGAAVGFSFWQTPTYEASLKLLIGQEASATPTQGSLSGTYEGLGMLTTTMVEAVNTRPVAEDAIQQLGMQEEPESLLSNLTVEQVGATQLIELTYTGSDPEQVRNVTNALGDVSARRISEASASANNVTATVWEYAVLPEEPISTTPLQNGLLGLGFGLLLGMGLALLLEFLDASWRSPEEVEQVSGLPTFGVIPKFKPVKIR